jgi:RNA polymerase sigma-70 factor, ECF subfamily
MTGHEADRRESDEVLVRRLLSGDEAALGKLYDRYGGRVYSVANRILQDSGAAEEVLQDIFHQLWCNAASFDSARGSLAGWLLVMARNRSIDRMRRRTPAIGDDTAVAAQGSAFDIEGAVARSEMAERVRAALQTLPEAQREAMELAYFEGLTQSEIAKRTGDPLGTIKTRLRTALASLKAELGE